MTKYQIKNPNNIFVRDNISLTTGRQIENSALLVITLYLFNL